MPIQILKPNTGPLMLLYVLGELNKFKKKIVPVKNSSK